MNNLVFIFFLFFLTISCSKPNNIGLEIQPPSDIIILGQHNNLLTISTHTERQDSVQSDKFVSNLITGATTDNVFGNHTAEIATQMLLSSNNIDLGNVDSLVIDSMFLVYDYLDYYPKYTSLDTSLDFVVYELTEDLFHDSIYYSNSSFEYDETTPISLNTSFVDTASTKLVKIELKSVVAQKIFDEYKNSNSLFTDNTSFLSFFKGFFISADMNMINTMLYLNPNGYNSKVTIFYHKLGSDTSLNLDFVLDGETQRISLFHKETGTNNFSSEKTYLQSMAGYKAKIILNDLSLLRDSLLGKSINKATISFKGINYDENYQLHPHLSLARINEQGDLVYLPDHFEGATHMGGELAGDEYTINITRYLHQLLDENPSYTNILYLRPSGEAINANQTILDNSQIQINITYSKL